MQVQKTKFTVRNTLAASQHQGRPEVDLNSIDEKYICEGSANEILPNLYLGDRTSASETMGKHLDSLNITGIVRCTIDSNADYNHKNVEYIQVAVNDNESANIKIYFSGCADFINNHLNQGGSVLVHCEMGSSRSASIVIAYLMKYHQYNLHNAFIKTKQHRTLTSPNLGFWKQLQEYEISLQNPINDTVSNERNNQEVLYNEAWCRQSCAEFQMKKTYQLNHIKSIEKQQEILFTGLDYVLGRCLVKSDIQWLKYICDIFHTSTSIQYLYGVIFDPNGEFLADWGCEFSANKLRGLLLDLGADESSPLFQPCISE